MDIRTEAVYIAEYLRLGTLVKFQLMCMLALAASWDGTTGIEPTIEAQILQSNKRTKGDPF